LYVRYKELMLHFRYHVSRNGISQPYMTVLFLPISHSHSLPLPLLLSYSLMVERNCDWGGMEDVVRAALPRRINRDRETRPLSHPPRFLMLLSSLSSLIPSGIPSEGPFLWLLSCASTSLHSLLLALPYLAILRCG